MPISHTDVRRSRRYVCAWAAAVVFAASCSAVGQESARTVTSGENAASLPGKGSRETAAVAHFDESLAPLLARKCLGCHDATEHKGGLDLSKAETAFAGGKQGRVIEPGKPEESVLWDRVEGDEMPPKTPLAPAEKELIRAWIADGAAWGASPMNVFRAGGDKRAGYDWWALRPVVRPRPPALAQDAGPIDSFLLETLQAKGVSPSPEADRRTLVRRLSFDLLGLPPTPEEVDAFIGDESPGAYETLVDRLLASPHYGERWARHWLDVVRFGESQGFEYNRLWPDVWRYRDWVVEALNDDLPYDEFVREQLAGDVLHPDDPMAVAATGQLVIGPYDQTMQDEGTAPMRAAAREEELEGIVATTAQAYLGLTVHCARCHDHKYDPIRQADYYRFAAALGGVRFGERNVLTKAGEAAAAPRRKALAQGVTELKNRKSAEGGAAERSELAARIARLGAVRRLNEPGKTHAFSPRQPEVFHVLERGDYRRPGAVVVPGGVSAVAGPPADFGLAPDAPEAERRRALAGWITDRRNPLTARVVVNRLWHHHFGVGLVDTPNDFGFNGGRPSHSKLLDWLASELMDRGWSLKHLHRLIVTSTAYRRSSRSRSEAIERDPGNRLLCRMAPRRLEAEAVRDAVLAISGDLDPSMGGPGFRDFSVQDGPSSVYEPIEAIGPEHRRRTLYRVWVRSGSQPLLDALDCPDPSVSTPRRTVTTTPLQALSLLNNALMIHAADRFAARLTREAGGDETRRIERAYLLAFGRPPDAEETAAARRFVGRHGLSPFCLALFNANEFVFID